MARFANLLSQRARLAWRTNKLHEYRTYPYYGVQATKSFAKLKPVIQAALAQVQHVIKGAIKIIAPMTYRERYHQSTGRDPLRCPHCSGGMALWRIWHPTYGVIYDEAKAIKRGYYERRRERDPTERGHRHPLWATA